MERVVCESTQLHHMRYPSSGTAGRRQAVCSSPKRRDREKRGDRRGMLSSCLLNIDGRADGACRSGNRPHGLLRRGSNVKAATLMRHVTREDGRWQ